MTIECDLMVVLQYDLPSLDDVVVVVVVVVAVRRLPACAFSRFESWKLEEAAVVDYCSGRLPL
jgi:hypothetical protein